MQTGRFYSCFTIA